MIYVGCGCTGSSSAFPRRTAIASRPRVEPTASPSWSLGLRAARVGVALRVGRATVARRQPKGVPHVTIASAYDREHEARRIVPGDAGRLYQSGARTGRALSPLTGPAQRGGGS